MMSPRSLLDVNVLIALLDPEHDFHSTAHRWWAEENHPAWASCPLTENGVVRIMSNPNYHSQANFSISKVSRLLVAFSEVTDHQFWPDGISLLNGSIFDNHNILGPKHITDSYLLALSVYNGGRLVTFDSGVSLASVIAAKPENLSVVC
jgi:toxin-antitoxin system PIN domain toxin